jgi:hypothetical protein
MLREIIALIGISLFLFANSAFAYVWKCHTPNGDVWTSQPAPSGDSEEYDDVYNPNAAPPPTTMQSPPPQIVPQAVPPPPPYVGTVLPAPYYYSPGYYGPGVYLAPPAYGYRYGGFYGRRYGGFYGGRYRR